MGAIVHRCLFEEADAESRELLSILIAEAMVNLRQLTRVTRLANVDPKDRSSVVLPIDALTRETRYDAEDE